MNFHNTGLGVEYLSSKTSNVLDIYSFTLGTSIKFLAFLTGFSDSYKSSWSTTEIYGRMDSVATFKNTNRKLLVAFDVPSNSLNDAKNNAERVDTLIKALYPIYENGPGGTSILSSPPLVRIKYANLIVSSANDLGLLGYLDGFDFTPELEQGMFIEGEMIYPKLYKVSLNFNVIHEHPLGNTKERAPRLKNSGFSHKYLGTKETDAAKKSVTTESTGQAGTQTEDAVDKAAASTVLEASK